MLIRRLLLVLFFLLAQAGALAHGIGHGGGPAGHDDAGLDPEVVCELCLAFAPMGSGLAGQQIAWSGFEPAPFAGAAGPGPLRATFPITTRSRDPPRLTW
ncbi:MAG: hypothetical protein AB1421_08575 [Pseudomonadota bacterium]